MFSATIVGKPKRKHLAHKKQIPLEIARIDDREHRIRRPRVIAAAEQHIDRHHLIRRPRREAVRAGQIDQLKVPLTVPQRAGLLFDRDARIIANPLPHAGERREQRRLPRVGITNQSNANRFWRCNWHDELVHHRDTEDTETNKYE